MLSCTLEFLVDTFFAEKLIIAATYANSLLSIGRTEAGRIPFSVLFHEYGAPFRDRELLICLN